MRVDEPIRVGEVELSGRIVFPPMATEGSRDGRPSQALVEHYREIAANPHVALVVTEHAYVHPSGKASPGQLSVAHDDDADGLAALADAIHAARAGVRAFAQISHAGANTRPEWTGGPLLAPSGVGRQVRALSEEGIAQVVRWFADAARRVREAGFDGVEVHSAHGYLLNEFLSPLANSRTDAYGADSLENRTRIHRAVLAAVREAVGPCFPVAVRLGAADYLPCGTTIAEGAQAARLLEAAGADLVDVSGGMCGMQRPGHREAGYFADASTAVRRAVSVPVITTGGVGTLRDAEGLLARGAGDLVGVGRALWRNPRWEA